MERKFRVIKDFKMFYSNYITEESKEVIENSGFTLIDERLVFKIGEIYTQYQLELAMGKIYKYMFNFQEISPAEEILEWMINEYDSPIYLTDIDGRGLEINVATSNREHTLFKKISKELTKYLKELMNKGKENEIK